MTRMAQVTEGVLNDEKQNWFSDSTLSFVAAQLALYLFCEGLSPCIQKVIERRLSTSKKEDVLTTSAQYILEHAKQISKNSIQEHGGFSPQHLPLLTEEISIFSLECLDYFLKTPLKAS
jgi:hypothetical protein